MQTDPNPLRGSAIPMEPLLITPKDAAPLLAISPRQLATLTKSGAIPSRKIGRSRRYSLDELRAWLAAGSPTAPTGRRRG